MSSLARPAASQIRHRLTGTRGCRVRRMGWCCRRHSSGCWRGSRPRRARAWCMWLRAQRMPRACPDRALAVKRGCSAPMSLMTCPEAGQHHVAWSPRAWGASGWVSRCCGHSGQVAGRPAAASSSISHSCSWSARSASRSGAGRLSWTRMPREPAPPGVWIQAHTQSGPRSSCASSRMPGTIAPLLRMSRRTGSRFARSSARSASVSARGFWASRHERRAAWGASGPMSRSIAAISSSSLSKNPPPCEPGCTARV